MKLDQKKEEKKHVKNVMNTISGHNGGNLVKAKQMSAKNWWFWILIYNFVWETNLKNAEEFKASIRRWESLKKSTKVKKSNKKSFPEFFLVKIRDIFCVVSHNLTKKKTRWQK